VGDNPSLTAESVETLVRVPDKRQAHFRTDVVALRGSLRPKHGTRVRLWDLVYGEVLRIDIGLELGFKGRTNATEAVPLYATEEGVLFDLVTASNAAEAVL
jgi:hypothetical protein